MTLVHDAEPNNNHCEKSDYKKKENLKPDLNILYSVKEKLSPYTIPL